MGTKAYSQLQESTFKLEYMAFPAGSDNIGFSKTGLENTSVFKLGKFTVENTSLIRAYQFTYPISFDLDTDELRSINNFSEKADFGYKITDFWEVHANIGVELVSTLKSKITEEDFLFTGGSYFKKILGSETTSHIILGAGYYTFFGKPQLFPLISYYREWSENFSMELGFPITSVNYHLTEKSNLKTTLDFTGMYVNLSDPVSIDRHNSAQKAELYYTSLKVEYDYVLDNSWSFNLGIGYLLNNEYNLLNRDNNKIFSINTTPRAYFTTGIKFNLKTKL